MDLIKTKYEGIYYRLNKKSQKVYVARFYLNGKAYKKTIGKEPQYNIKLAVKKRLEFIEEVESGKVLNSKSLKSEFYNYLDINSKNYNPKWAYNYKTSFDKHTPVEIKDKKIDKITTLDLQKIANSMLESYAPKTIKTYIDMIKAFYNYKIKLRELNFNPASFITLPKFDNSREFALTLQECKSFFEVLLNYENDIYRAFFIFLLHGRRKGEVININWSNIDFENKKYTLKYHQTKNRKNSSYPITPILESELLNIKSMNLHDEIIFYNSNTKNNRFSIGGLNWHWKKLKEKSNLHDKDFVIHDLRHMLGFISVNSGFTFEMIGKTLGQNTIQMAKRYSKVSDDSVNSVLENFLNVLSK